MSAQAGKVNERTKIETDDAKVVTWTGCLRASKDGFDLTEVTRDPSAGKETRTPTMVYFFAGGGTSRISTTSSSIRHQDWNLRHPGTVQKWDEVPGPGEGMKAADEAIRRRVTALVEELLAQQRRPPS